MFPCAGSYRSGVTIRLLKVSGVKNGLSRGTHRLVVLLYELSRIRQRLSRVGMNQLSSFGFLARNRRSNKAGVR